MLASDGPHPAPLLQFLAYGEVSAVAVGPGMLPWDAGAWQQRVQEARLAPPPPHAARLHHHAPRLGEAVSGSGDSASVRSASFAEAVGVMEEPEEEGDAAGGASSPRGSAAAADPDTDTAEDSEGDRSVDDVASRAASKGRRRQPLAEVSWEALQCQAPQVGSGGLGGWRLTG